LPDRDEDQPAQPDLSLIAQPDPQGQRKAGQRRRERIVDESEVQDVRIGQRHGEDRARRDPAMNDAAEQQHAAGLDNRNGNDDEPHRRFDAEQRPQPRNEQINAQIWDHNPLKIIPSAQIRAGSAIDLDGKAPHMGAKVAQRGHTRHQQRNGRHKRQKNQQDRRKSSRCRNFR